MNFEPTTEFEHPREDDIFADVDEALHGAGISAEQFAILAPRLRAVVMHHVELGTARVFVDICASLPDTSSFVLCLKKELGIETRSLSQMGDDIATSKQAVHNKATAVRHLLQIVHCSILGQPLPTPPQSESATDSKQLELFN